MMDKCPYCGAETRPGDNYCLNCGNRLTVATPSPASKQAQPGMGEATVAAPDEWGAAAPGQSDGWGDSGVGSMAPALAEPQAYHVENAPTAQATIERIEHPARFILRSESGEELQEYPLEKPEITIGRAPSSDILLSKDKLTSRRHATVRYEDGHYVLRDERSANGTYVNGQQLEEMTPKVLYDGDLIGIGEHELVFSAYGSSDATVSANVEDLPTVRFNAPSELPAAPSTERTAVEEEGDEFRTHGIEGSEVHEAPAPAPVPSPYAATPAATSPGAPVVPQPAQSAPVAVPYSFSPASEPPTPTPAASSPSPSTQANSSPARAGLEEGLTFNRLTNLPQPVLPDMTALMAAMSTLDGQVMSLQEQFAATQESMRSYEDEIAKATNQLRSGVRRVSDRMDSTIADVARSREALSWAELLQLMEDVMNNPRDIEYVTKLARKARELNKVFQIHQNVLNTMAECNSLLRSLIGEDK